MTTPGFRTAQRIHVIRVVWASGVDARGRRYEGWVIPPANPQYWDHYPGLPNVGALR